MENTNAVAPAGIKLFKEKPAQAMGRAKNFGHRVSVTAGIKMRKENEQISSYLISASFNLLFQGSTK